MRRVKVGLSGLVGVLLLGASVTACSKTQYPTSAYVTAIGNSKMDLQAKDFPCFVRAMVRTVGAKELSDKGISPDDLRDNDRKAVREFKDALALDSNDELKQAFMNDRCLDFAEFLTGLIEADFKDSPDAYRSWIRSAEPSCIASAIEDDGDLRYLFMEEAWGRYPTEVDVDASLDGFQVVLRRNVRAAAKDACGAAPPTTTTTTTVPPPAPAPAPRVSATMPNVLCMNLQSAQNAIQARGVFYSRSRDATGQGRSQIIDSNWVVVDQYPAPGSPIGEGTAVLSVVQYGEGGPC